MTNDSIFAGRTAIVVRFVGLAALAQSVIAVFVNEADRAAAVAAGPLVIGAWLASVAVFAAAFVASTFRIGNDEYRGRVLQLVVVQTLTMVVTTATTAASTRPEIWLISAQLGFVHSLPMAMVLTIAEGALVIVTRTVTHGSSAAGLLWIYCRDILPYSALVVITANLLEREKQTRKALARANAELRAMQTLAAEQERTSERLRISRELHDLLGHHLTALSLNLEAVKHLLRSEPQALVDRCHTITKELLSDLRHVVSMLRGHERIDLTRVLTPLVDEVRRPSIHLVLPRTWTMSATTTRKRWSAASRRSSRMPSSTRARTICGLSSRRPMVVSAFRRGTTASGQIASCWGTGSSG